MKVLLREGVAVWPPSFEWSEYCPLGSRSAKQIDAWVAGGMEYMYQRGFEGATRRIAATKEGSEKKKRTWPWA